MMVDERVAMMVLQLAVETAGMMGAILVVLKAAWKAVLMAERTVGTLASWMENSTGLQMASRELK